MEINITQFIAEEDPYNFSGSVAEHGDNVAQITWSNAKRKGERSPLLTTPEQLDALRAHVKEFGAWDKDEIASWSDIECNALFIQLVSGDMREAGMDDVDLEDFDWEDYEQRAHAGQISGIIFRADDGQIYYYLGT